MDFKETKNTNTKSELVDKSINYKSIILYIMLIIFIYPMIIYSLSIYTQAFAEKGFAFTYISVVVFALDLLMVIHTFDLIKKCYMMIVSASN